MNLMNENKTDTPWETISTLDRHGTDRPLARLVDFHGEPRRDIPPQLLPAQTRRLPVWRRAA
jgi:hypothetical protein